MAYALCFKFCLSDLLVIYIIFLNADYKTVLKYFNTVLISPSCGSRNNRIIEPTGI